MGRGERVAAAIVVAHLEEDEVAGFDFGEDFIPGALVDVGAAGASGAGAVGDVDACGVEDVGDVVAPAEVGLIAGGGVADDEEGGMGWVERSGGSDVGLGLGASGPWALGRDLSGREDGLRW